MSRVIAAVKACGQGDIEFSQVLYAWSHLDVLLRETIDESKEGTIVEQFMEVLSRK